MLSAWLIRVCSGSKLFKALYRSASLFSAAVSTTIVWTSTSLKALPSLESLRFCVYINISFASLCICAKLSFLPGLLLINELIMWPDISSLSLCSRKPISDRLGWSTKAWLVFDSARGFVTSSDANGDWPTLFSFWVSFINFYYFFISSGFVFSSKSSLLLGSRAFETPFRQRT